MAGRLVGVIRREFAAPHYVMVVGTGERAVRLGRGLEQSGDYGIRLRGFLSETPAAPPKSNCARLYQVLPIARSARAAAPACDRRNHLRGAPARAWPTWKKSSCCATKKACAPAWRWISSRTSTARSPGTLRRARRCSRFRPRRTTRSGCCSSASPTSCIAAPALVVLAPFMLLVALLIRADLAGPGDFPPGALRAERPPLSCSTSSAPCATTPRN